MGKERVSTGQGITGRPAVAKRQDITVNRTRGRSSKTEPAQTDPGDDEQKEGSREKGRQEEIGQGKRRKL